MVLALVSEATQDKEEIMQCIYWNIIVLVRVAITEYHRLGC